MEHNHKKIEDILAIEVYKNNNDSLAVEIHKHDNDDSQEFVMFLLILQLN